MKGWKWSWDLREGVHEHLVQAGKDEALVWGAPAGFSELLLIPCVPGGGAQPLIPKGLSLGHLLMGWQHCSIAV